ncbi:Transposon Ty3-I Gag-Pol polyprotein [Nosema granulosis]|uniref:Transposon Ty3-I Gag-Pol polyprotein n=1 Tax=Nosema granulosis TaxID=83296 RepID=A0A9P6GZW9_9MICR|nr:Transposon Ty3-I Gag-Pol polyprotein [Nosema granulosis]
MEKSDKQKTAFAWKTGLYEWERMPFGLCNAPASFQMTMDQIFLKERSRFVLVYLDDIIVFSNNKEEHEAHLDIVLGRLRASGISLNRSKCRLYKIEIKTL